MKKQATKISSLALLGGRLRPTSLLSRSLLLWKSRTCSASEGSSVRLDAELGREEALLLVWKPNGRSCVGACTEHCKVFCQQQKSLNKAKASCLHTIERTGARAVAFLALTSICEPRGRCTEHGWRPT